MPAFGSHSYYSPESGGQQRLNRVLADGRRAAIQLKQSFSTGGLMSADGEYHIHALADSVFDSFSQAISILHAHVLQESTSYNLFESSKVDFDSPVVKTTGQRRRGYKRRKPCERIEETFGLWDDGYEWRKYGEKKINNFRHTRSYFRCSYENCEASKQVQKIQDDPPLYKTFYFSKHTCTNAIKQSIQSFEIGQETPEGSSILSFGIQKGMLKSVMEPSSFEIGQEMPENATGSSMEFLTSSENDSFYNEEEPLKR